DEAVFALARSRRRVRHLGNFAVEKLFEVLLELADVAAASAKRLENGVFAEQRPKDVFQSEILVVSVHGVSDCQIKYGFCLASDHSSSLTQAPYCTSAGSHGTVRVLAPAPLWFPRSDRCTGQRHLSLPDVPSA